MVYPIYLTYYIVAYKIERKPTRYILSTRTKAWTNHWTAAQLFTSLEDAIRGAEEYGLARDSFSILRLTLESI